MKTVPPCASKTFCLRVRAPGDAAREPDLRYALRMARRFRRPPPDLMRRLAHLAAEKVPTRTYMSLSLLGAMLVGFLFSAGLLALGMHGLVGRWALVSLAAYATFLMLCRVALSPLVEEAVPGHDDRLLPDLSGSSGPDLVDLGHMHSSGGGGAPVGDGPAPEDFGGGRSGGGGAGSIWGEPRAGSGGGGGGGGGGDVDGEGVVALLLIGVVLALFGASIYVIWQAPVILTEAAFEVLLAAGLARAAKRRGWASALFNSTILPFLVVFGMILGLGWASQHFCPEADRLSLVVECAQGARED